MRYTILHLPKEQWQGHSIEIDEYGFGFTPREFHLYDERWPNACAWGVLNKGKLLAVIETTPVNETNNLRITVIWVDITYRRHGIGHALLDIAREQARLERRDAIVIDILSRDADAVDFCASENLTLTEIHVGQRESAFVEYCLFTKKLPQLARDDVEIREEHTDEWHDVERMLQLAFWNKMRMGTDVHYFVHKLRSAKEYVPRLSRVLLKDGKIIGAIFFARAYVYDENRYHELLTFGPLGVSPDWQGRGVGRMLLDETLKLAAAAGHRGVMVFGVPDYYPKLGFVTADNFGITTKDGENFKAFMGIELYKGALDGIHGKLYLPPVYDELPADEVEEYNKHFSPLVKQYFPMQWE